MNVPHNKRIEYWNHFIEVWIIYGQGGGYGVTGPKLRKIKSLILKDDFFWQDIVLRHDGLIKIPEQMRQDNILTYEHCAGNFWGMVMQTLVERGLIK